MAGKALRINLFGVAGASGKRPAVVVDHPRFTRLFNVLQRNDHLLLGNAPIIQLPTSGNGATNTGYIKQGSYTAYEEPAFGTIPTRTYIETPTVERFCWFDVGEFKGLSPAGDHVFLFGNAIMVRWTDESAAEPAFYYTRNKPWIQVGATNVWYYENLLRTAGGGTISSVKEDARNTLATMTVTNDTTPSAGEWYYDRTTDRLYVQMSSSAQPDVLAADEVIVPIFHNISMVNSPITAKDSTTGVHQTPLLPGFPTIESFETLTTAQADIKVEGGGEFLNGYLVIAGITNRIDDSERKQSIYRALVADVAGTVYIPHTNWTNHPATNVWKIQNVTTNNPSLTTDDSITWLKWYNVPLKHVTSIPTNPGEWWFDAGTGSGTLYVYAPYQITSLGSPAGWEPDPLSTAPSPTPTLLDSSVLFGDGGTTYDVDVQLEQITSDIKDSIRHGDHIIICTDSEIVKLRWIMETGHTVLGESLSTAAPFSEIALEFNFNEDTYIAGGVFRNASVFIYSKGIYYLQAPEDVVIKRIDDSGYIENLVHQGGSILGASFSDKNSIILKVQTKALYSNTYDTHHIVLHFRGTIADPTEVTELHIVDSDVTLGDNSGVFWTDNDLGGSWYKFFGTDATFPTANTDDFFVGLNGKTVSSSSLSPPKIDADVDISSLAGEKYAVLLKDADGWFHKGTTGTEASNEVEVDGINLTTIPAGLDFWIGGMFSFVEFSKIFDSYYEAVRFELAINSPAGFTIHASFKNGEGNFASFTEVVAVGESVVQFPIGFNCSTLTVQLVVPRLTNWIAIGRMSVDIAAPSQVL